MTPRELGNIYNTGKSRRGILPCATWTLNYQSIFTCWWKSLLVAISKFSLLTIWRQSATRKHLLMYPQGDRSGLSKPKTKSIKTNRSYHQRSSPKASLNWSNNNIRFSFNQPNWKRWGVNLFDVIKHLPHTVFLFWHHIRRVANQG